MTKAVAILLLVFAICASAKTNPLYGNFSDVAAYLNYPVESHEVITEDGYILKIFRIAGKKGESLYQARQARRPVVLYLHGYVVFSFF